MKTHHHAHIHCGGMLEIANSSASIKYTATATATIIIHRNVRVCKSYQIKSNCDEYIVTDVSHSAMAPPFNPSYHRSCVREKDRDMMVQIYNMNQYGNY